MNFSIDDAIKLLNMTFGITCCVYEFVTDISFQDENRKILQTRNARDIVYRLGRTEERYDNAIRLCDTITGIAARIRNTKTPVSAPVMQMAPRKEYTVCSICYRQIMVSVPWQGYFWQPTPAIAKCYDCDLLDYLTDRILLFSAIQKAQEKGIEKAVEKGIDWLARQFGNDADEIRRTYYAERGGKWA